MEGSFWPRTEAGLDLYVENTLKPRRTDPRWAAAYNEAYALAETVWPTGYAHKEREIFAHLSADIAMSTALNGDPPANPPPATSPPEPERARALPPKQARKTTVRPETVAELHKRQADEAKLTLERMASSRAASSPLVRLGSPNPTNDDGGSRGFGFAANVSQQSRIEAGWARAIANAGDGEGIHGVIRA